MENKQIQTGFKFFCIALKELGIGAIFLAMLIYIFVQFQALQNRQFERMEIMLKEARDERNTHMEAIKECCKANRKDK